MKRKYLDDIGVKNRPDTWCPNDRRQKKWEKSRKKYGFDQRETYSLDYSWHLWLYERFMMFLECVTIDLDYHKFEFKGEEYTQRQMIQMMIDRLKFSFQDSYNDMDEEQWKYVAEIEEIWAKVVGCMWW